MKRFFGRDRKDSNPKIRTVRSSINDSFLITENLFVCHIVVNRSGNNAFLIFETLGKVPEIHSVRFAERTFEIKKLSGLEQLTSLLGNKTKLKYSFSISKDVYEKIITQLRGKNISNIKNPTEFDYYVKKINQVDPSYELPSFQTFSGIFEESTPLIERSRVEGDEPRSACCMIL